MKELYISGARTSVIKPRSQKLTSNIALKFANSFTIISPQIISGFFRTDSSTKQVIDTLHGKGTGTDVL